MTGAVRWGLLGTAHINRRLIPAMRQAARSVVTAVASRESQRARDTARQWDIPVAHAGYESLLRDPAVDAVYIPLPNALHVEWTLRALDAGKHVLCEKPLALVAEDVDRIAAVARGRGLVVAEGFMFRHEPLIRQVLALVREGAVGGLQRLSAGFTYQQSRQADVRLDASLGGGSVWDVGCYTVNVVRLLAGAEPTEVFGFATMAHGVDDMFSGLLKFPGGVVADVSCGFRAPYRTWLEVRGDAGVLRVANPFKPSAREEILLERDETIRRLVVEGSPQLFVRQVEDFVGAALDGRGPVVSLTDSRGNAAALAALLASARSGRAVQI